LRVHFFGATINGGRKAEGPGSSNEKGGKRKKKQRVPDPSGVNTMGKHASTLKKKGKKRGYQVRGKRAGREGFSTGCGKVTKTALEQKQKCEKGRTGSLHYKGKKDEKL